MEQEIIYDMMHKNAILMMYPLTLCSAKLEAPTSTVRSLETSEIGLKQRELDEVMIVQRSKKI